MIRKLSFLILAILASPLWMTGQAIKTIIIEGAPAIDGNGVFRRRLTGPTFDKVVLTNLGRWLLRVV
jgi:hypothetical protein